MGTEWSLHDAQNNLSDVVKAACTGNPQFIYINNQEEAVIISSETWKRLSVIKPIPSFKDALFSIPKGDAFIDEERNHALNPRKTEL